MKTIEGKNEAILSGLRFVADYGTGSAPAEIVDAALDSLDWTVYLTPEEFFEVEVEMTREVYALLGLDSGASDATFVSRDAIDETIRTLVRREVVQEIVDFIDGDAENGPRFGVAVSGSEIEAEVERRLGEER